MVVATGAAGDNSDDEEFRGPIDPAVQDVVADALGAIAPALRAFTAHQARMAANLEPALRVPADYQARVVSTLEPALRALAVYQTRLATALAPSFQALVANQAQIAAALQPALRALAANQTARGSFSPESLVVIQSKAQYDEMRRVVAALPPIEEFERVFESPEAEAPNQVDIQWWRQIWNGMDHFERIAFVISIWIIGQLLAFAFQVATTPSVAANPTAALAASGRGIYDSIVAAMIVGLTFRRQSH